MKIFYLIILIHSSILSANVSSTRGVINFKPQKDGDATMILNHTGLGIGTTPSSNLHVNGNVFISQHLNVGQNQGGSDLNIHGSIGFNFETVSSDTTLSDNTLILVNTTSDNVILTLPSADLNEGRVYKIKRIIDNSHFVRITSSDLIDASTDDIDLSGLNTVHLFSNGSDWYKITPVTSAPQIVASANLLGWWKLDEMSGNTIIDASNNNNHGVYNGTIESVNGSIHSAVDFDGGSEQVDIPNESFFDLSSAITISCWIKVDNLDTNWQGIVTKGDNSWRLHRNSSTNLINFACNGLAGGTSLNNTTEVNDGQWHHIVAIYDGSNQSIFTNGVLENTAARTGSISTNDYTVAIGENIQHNNREWEGAIDDVRIYDYGLTANQVFQIYNQGK